jgi:hypothetical protein
MVFRARVHTGSEAAIVRGLIQADAMALIDVLALECHASRYACQHLMSEIRRAAPKLKVWQEGRTGAVYSGQDDYHLKHSEVEMSTLQQACDLLDPTKFAISIKSRTPPDT